MKKIRHFVVVFAVFLITLFLILYPQNNTDKKIFISDNQAKYQEIISGQLMGENVIFSPYDSAINELSLGDCATVNNIQAQPFLKHEPNYNFMPHIAQTVVIAIDRDATDVQINSFADLLEVEGTITFDIDDRFDPSDWGTPKAQQIILSMAYALDENYDIKAVGEFMRKLWDEDRFAYQDMWQPIVITLDNVAAEYIERGRNLEIIVPEDCAFTLEYGLLYHGEKPQISPEIDNELIKAGYRLTDGRADPKLYPADYTNAKTPTDEEAFRKASAELGAIIRRETFNADLYNYANVVEYTAIFLVFLLFLIMYLFSILRRMTDKYIANSLVIATITAVVFIVLGLLKYLVEDNPVIETILWYSFYIPIYTMTASLVYVMMRAEHSVRPTNIDRAIKWFKWYVFAEIAVLILIFTNHFHEWVFIVTDYEHSYHSYNWGYAIVLGMMYIGILVTLITLISQCVHSPRKKMFFCPAIMVAIMFAYSCGHIFDFEPVLNFEISFAISLLAVLFAELCIISRIFPNNKGHKTLFLHSSLAMQIKDLDNKTVESSLITQEKDENYILRQWEISGGKFLFFEDQTSLNNMTKNLEQVNEKRRENNRLLLQKSKFQADLAALSVQRQIYESIDEILLDGTEKIENLSKVITQNHERKRAMATVNILACIMKRACMFHINLLYQQSQQTSIFIKALNELGNYCSALGITLTVSCRTEKDLLSSQVVSMYTVCTLAIERAIELNASTLLVQIYEDEGDIILSILGNIPLFPVEMQQNIRNLTVKPWEETEIYLLNGKEGQSL